MSCSVIYGDLNSPKVVRLNAFHMYLVAAIKFHILVKKLPQQPSKNPFFFSCDRRRMSLWCLADKDRCKKFGEIWMADEEVICIGPHGFFSVLVGSGIDTQV